MSLLSNEKTEAQRVGDLCSNGEAVTEPEPQPSVFGVCCLLPQESTEDSFLFSFVL